MRRYLRPLILITVLALALTACGDDDFGGTDLGNTDLGSVDLGDASGAIPGIDDATIPPAVGDIAGVSSECVAYANLSIALTSVFSGAPASDFSDDIVSALPAEGQADGAIIVGALREFSARLNAAGIDLSQGMATLSQEQLQAFSDLSDEIFDDDVETAFDHLSDLVSVQCATGG